MYTTERLEELLLSAQPLHCYSCGYVLVNAFVNYLGIVEAKCVNPQCRMGNSFLHTDGRFRLLTHKLLVKMDEKELLPYKKSDILKLVVK